jgi:hypothetical protein
MKLNEIAKIMGVNEDHPSVKALEEFINSPKKQINFKYPDKHYGIYTLASISSKLKVLLQSSSFPPQKTINVYQDILANLSEKDAKWLNSFMISESPESKEKAPVIEIIQDESKTLQVDALGNEWEEVPVIESIEFLKELPKEAIEKDLPQVKKPRKNKNK